MGAATGRRLSINEVIMPPTREEEYQTGFKRGYELGYSRGHRDGMQVAPWEKRRDVPGGPFKKKKRKLSAWNKFVKANSKKPRFKYRDGKLNLKKMAVAFRKTPAGKKKRR